MAERSRYTSWQSLSRGRKDCCRESTGEVGPDADEGAEEHSGRAETSAGAHQAETSREHVGAELPERGALEGLRGGAFDNYYGY